MKAPELTALAIDWALGKYPGAHVVRELSVADWGGALLDVGIITDSEIIGVEVKGDGDSPARLPLQAVTYPRVCTRMWLLPAPGLMAKCREAKPNGWGLLELHAGAVRRANVARRRVPPPEGTPPHVARYMKRVYEHDPDRYEPAREADRLRQLCPWSLCGTLWAEELRIICKEEADRHPELARLRNIRPMVDALVETLPVPRLYEHTVRRLRERKWRGRKRVLGREE